MDVLTIGGKRIFIGATVDMSGCFADKNSLWGNISEIENRLGFHNGRLRKGFFVAQLTRIPTKNEFKLSGYTNIPSHKQSYKNYAGLDIEVLMDNAHKRLKQIGCSNLVKIIPVILHNNDIESDIQYPSGTGVAQWEILRGTPIPMLVYKFIEGYCSRVKL